MKLPPALLAIVATMPAWGEEPTAAIPTGYPAARYDVMAQEAPFAVATATTLVVATPSFAADLYVTGIGRIGDRDHVTISSRDKTRRFSIFAGDPIQNSEGIEVIKVDWSEAVGGSKVSVKKGSEFGILSFDQATLSQPSAPTAGIATPPGVPGVPGVVPPVPPQVNAAGPRPTNAPRVIRRRLPPIPGPR